MKTTVAENPVVIGEEAHFIYMNGVFPTCYRCDSELSFHEPDLDYGVLTIICKCGSKTKVYSQTDTYPKKIT